jgi:hypothetical protein
MMFEESAPQPAMETLREELLELFEDVKAGLLAMEDFVEQASELLNQLPLYPTTTVLALGVAIGEKLEKSPGLAVELTVRLVGAPAREVRAMAAVVIHRIARFQPGMWVDTIRHLVADDDWEVRDLAARVFDTLEAGEGAAEFHLMFVHETVKSWVTDSDYLVRRAATQALTGYAINHADFRPLLLDMLRPLLDDQREYVRRGLAATLRTLGKADGALIFDYLEAAANPPTPRVAETIRLVMEHRFAGKFPVRKAALLSGLPAADPTPDPDPDSDPV